MSRLVDILIFGLLILRGNVAVCHPTPIQEKPTDKILWADSVRFVTAESQTGKTLARADLNKTYFRSQDLPDDEGISKKEPVASAPETIRVEPASGNYLGGCDNRDYCIEITGGHFGSGWDINRVTICGVEVCQIVMQSANSVVVYPGCGMPGTGDIVINSESKGTTIIKNGFTYRVSKPAIAASRIVYSWESDSCAEISWERGDGEACVVFMKQASTGSAAPSDRQAFQASDRFGRGSQIGSSGWFCVYNGRGNSASVKKLTPGADYVVEVIEYNGQRGFETYLSPDSNQKSIHFRQYEK